MVENNSPHSINVKNPVWGSDAQKAKMAEASKPKPKKAPVDHRALIIERLRKGDLLLMRNAKHWTYSTDGRKVPAATVRRMIKQGELVGNDDCLFPPNDGKLARSQTWRLADDVA